MFCSVSWITSNRARDEPLPAHRPSESTKLFGGFGRLPVGFEHVEVGGVPRSILWRGGVKQAFSVLRMLASTGGFRPMYQAHLGHRIRQSHFLLVCNRDAQVKQYKIIADCLRMNPQYRGLMGVSWYYDPQLETVSPYLAFLRQFPLEHGALAFRYGSGPAAERDALSRSPERQKLHREGKYRPVEFMVVWPRKSLIAWAEQR